MYSYAVCQKSKLKVPHEMKVTCSSYRGTSYPLAAQGDMAAISSLIFHGTSVSLKSHVSKKAHLTEILFTDFLKKSSLFLSKSGVR